MSACHRLRGARTDALAVGILCQSHPRGGNRPPLTSDGRASAAALSGIADRVVAKIVVAHKSCFFAEKDAAGTWIDYSVAVGGGLQIVPTGAARDALAKDYATMVADGVMLGGALSFDDLMLARAGLQDRATA